VHDVSKTVAEKRNLMPWWRIDVAVRQMASPAEPERVRYLNARTSTLRNRICAKTSAAIFAWYIS
jgi:hypothetical protein